MRIDQAGDDRLAGQVAHRSLVGDLNFGFRSDRHDLALVDNQRPLVDRSPADGVDPDAAVSDGRIRRRRRIARPSRYEEPRQKDAD